LFKKVAGQADDFNLGATAMGDVLGENKHFKGNTFGQKDIL